MSNPSVLDVLAGLRQLTPEEVEQSSLDAGNPPGFQERLNEEMTKHWNGLGSIREKEKTANIVLEKVNAEFGLEPFIIPANEITTVEQADEALFRCNSYTTLDYLVELMEHVEFTDWYELASVQWPSTDNVCEHSLVLHSYFKDSTQEHKLLMMNEEELKLYHSLPDKVTVYRGCSDIN